MFKQESATWSSFRFKAAEPTCNHAECVSRRAVLWRKNGGGTDSEAGSRFVERMLSVVATRRQQHRGVLELFSTSYAAQLDGYGAPSLLRSEVGLAAA